MKKLFMRLWQKLKKILKFFLNWRFVVSFGIAWMITNGWAYICLGLGIWFDINWLAGVAGSYVAFLYLPFTPEKLITIPLAILICKIIFPKQKRIREELTQLYNEEKNKLKRRKKDGKNNKSNTNDKEPSSQ